MRKVYSDISEHENDPPPPLLLALLSLQRVVASLFAWIGMAFVDFSSLEFLAEVDTLLAFALLAPSVTHCVLLMFSQTGVRVFQHHHQQTKQVSPAFMRARAFLFGYRRRQSETQSWTHSMSCRMRSLIWRRRHVRVPSTCVRVCSLVVAACTSRTGVGPHYRIFTVLRFRAVVDALFYSVSTWV